MNKPSVAGVQRSAGEEKKCFSYCSVYLSKRILILN
jgi:hypothetical protein